MSPSCAKNSDARRATRNTIDHATVEPRALARPDCGTRGCGRCRRPGTRSSASAATPNAVADVVPVEDAVVRIDVAEIGRDADRARSGANSAMRTMPATHDRRVGRRRSAARRPAARAARAAPALARCPARRRRLRLPTALHHLARRRDSSSDATSHRRAARLPAASPRGQVAQKVQEMLRRAVMLHCAS